MYVQMYIHVFVCMPVFTTKVLTEYVIKVIDAFKIEKHETTEKN